MTTEPCLVRSILMPLDNTEEKLWLPLELPFLSTCPFWLARFFLFIAARGIFISCFMISGTMKSNVITIPHVTSTQRSRIDLSTPGSSAMVITKNESQTAIISFELMWYMIQIGLRPYSNTNGPPYVTMM
eukprot:CAMPEP_0182527784 /NCGR_PEP_ID=MMETSP1323-20130603/4077_1 /TAXON_ID=236787 /ORGANISM="Florenciella parvula, Strain RCC1693" /LENGTH=129 /DNA_ID=CAMNT_0024736817 /DNA_START=285 /DNA_END=674 /DNA_ORIENTATION=+